MKCLALAPDVVVDGLVPSEAVSASTTSTPSVKPVAFAPEVESVTPIDAPVSLERTSLPSPLMVAVTRPSVFSPINLARSAKLCESSLIMNADNCSSVAVLPDLLPTFCTEIMISFALAIPVPTEYITTSLNAVAVTPEMLVLMFCTTSAISSAAATAPRSCPLMRMSPSAIAWVLATSRSTRPEMKVSKPPVAVEPLTNPNAPVCILAIEKSRFCPRA